jgi:hypothetical protein
MTDRAMMRIRKPPAGIGALPPNRLNDRSERADFAAASDIEILSAADE